MSIKPQIKGNTKTGGKTQKFPKELDQDTRKELAEELKVWDKNEDMEYSEVKAAFDKTPDRILGAFFAKKASDRQIIKTAKEWEGLKEHKKLYHLAKALKKRKRQIDGINTKKWLDQYKPTIWGNITGF